MKTIKKASLLFASLALVLGAGLVGNSDTKEVKAAEVITTDTITADKLTATGTTYKDFSEVTINSSAVYAGNNAKNNVGAIQLRSSNSNSGIVSTASGGILKSISIVVSSGTKTLDIYGANSAYSSASDLYKSATQGKKLGSLSSTGTFNFPEDITYQFIGLRSSSGALYLSSIEISWSNASLDDPTPIINLINKIGTVEYNDDCLAKITAARDAYEAANEDVKNGVTNYQTLVDAENKYKELKSADDKAKVAAAEKLVNDLPSADEIIDLSRKTEIEDAEAAYLALTKEQKNIYNPAILEKLNKLVAKIEALDPSNEVLFDFTKTGSDAASISKSPLVVDDIKVSLDKGTSTNDFWDEPNPIRLYTNQILTLSSLAPVRNLTEIKITADTAAYAKVMSNSKYSSEVTVTVAKTIVTIVPKHNISTLSVTFSAQTRWENMVVVYEKDSTSLFESDWAALRAKGGENGICYFLTNDTRAELDALIARYNAFSAEDQATIGSKADGGTTIANTIEYVSALLAKLDSNSSTGASGVVITSNNSYDKTSLIALFAILGIVAISGYYIIEKKKFSK